MLDSKSSIKLRFTIKRLVLLLTVFVVAGAYISGDAIALSQAQIQVFQEGILYFNTEDSTACTSSNGVVVGNAQGLGPTMDGHSLPAASGGLGEEEAAVISNGRAVLAPGTSHPGAPLSLAPAGMTQQDATFYINMRWRYAVWAWDGTSQIGPEQSAWYEQAVRKVKVTNTTNGKSVVASVLESGPAPFTGTKEGSGNPPSYWQGYVDGTPSTYDGRVAGLSPAAFEAISSPGLEWANGSGDKVNFDWVDSSVQAGTVSGAGTTSVAGGNSSTDCSAVGSGNFATNFVFYNQYDPKWANHAFGSSTIAASGCGPTSVAMVVTNLTGNTVTPDQTADFGTSNGGYVPGQGSSYEKMLIEGPEHYGLKVTTASSMADAITALQHGALVIAAGDGEVPYTTSGHVIVLRAVTSDGKILVGDPDGAHTTSDTTAFDQATIMAGNLGLWIVTKN